MNNILEHKIIKGNSVFETLKKCVGCANLTQLLRRLLPQGIHGMPTALLINIILVSVNVFPYVNHVLY